MAVDNPCIICLEPKDTITIDDLIPVITLIKPCTCKFYTHDKCIVLWITKNPTCPYCKQLLCFECCKVVVGANVLEANVVGANVLEANVVRANVVGANVVGANVVEANVVEANVLEANVVPYKNNICVRYSLIIVFIVILIIVFGNAYLK
jgi:hypothetical protein